MLTGDEINAGHEDREDETVRLDDGSLVDRARAGDQTAFYELVRRHRIQACGIARALTRDEHLAEDIVQEALIRAFLQLSTLVQSSRFLPWFHRIVRTQAWMKLRRGGRFGREVPFTGLAGARPDAAQDAEHWQQVDRMLFRLQRQQPVSGCSRAADPLEELLRREWLARVGELLNCLSRKERAIFEAHFMNELSAQEIAASMRTTTGYVYTSLSRSRAKVQQERLRVFVKGYVQERRERGLPVKKKLDASIIHFK